jgi:transcriptional regulator with XRE-family HTH domain
MANPSPTQRDLDDALLRFAAQMRRLREHRGLSQSSAAARAGIPQSEWSRYESRKRRPSLETALRVQHALEQSTLEALFGPLPSQIAAQDLGHSASCADYSD